MQIHTETVDMCDSENALALVDNICILVSFIEFHDSVHPTVNGIIISNYGTLR